jgi:hypothetical protein
MVNKKSKIPGLYWDKATGAGSIDKRIPGAGRVRHRFSAGTWQEAEAEYHNAIAEAKAQATKPGATITFRAAATQYLNEETKPSLKRDAISLALLDPYIGSIPLDQIHDGTLRPYMEARRADGIKSATIARDIAIVRRILTLASRVWRDRDNRPLLPTAPPLLRKPDWHDQAEPYPLSHGDQSRLLQCLPAHLARMALFCLQTGLSSPSSIPAYSRASVQFPACT